MKSKGPILLLITAILWGVAFTAQASASSYVEPFTFNASRNFIGAIFLTAVISFRKRTKRDIPPVKNENNYNSADKRTFGVYSTRTLIVAGSACGVVLCAASFLQQAGITAYPDGAAASGRSGFVTATYMVMVAVMALFAGKKAHPIVFVSVGIALLGMYLLCVPNGFDSVYVGDWLVLFSAFGYALHIMVIDRFTNVDGVRLSRVQLIVAGGVSLVLALAFESPNPSNILAAAIPILYAGIMSDGVAYTLQIVGQKTTDPTVASIIMSLESVFAALGGWIILHEVLGPVELIGCALVFAAVIMSQVPDFVKSPK